MMDNASYDVVIIGGGPAGLTAGLYTSRGRLNSLLIEKELIGGQITNAELIENYPGFPEGIGGMELGQRIYQQATKYGLKTLNAEATGIELRENRRIVKTTEGDFTTRAVIIAGSSKRQTMDVPGEEKYVGKGVSYCATCDGAFFKEQPVAVIGGGNAAISEALHLTKFASRVTVIHRRQQLRASRILQERAFGNPKIGFLWDTIVEEVEGEAFVTGLKLSNAATGEKSTLKVAGVFVAIGFKPDTGSLKDILPLDAVGHIITNEKMETGVPGIFAAGDIRSTSVRQAIAAAGDGATAAVYAERFLSEQ